MLKIIADPLLPPPTVVPYNFPSAPKASPSGPDPSEQFG
jgi:hypothetical protein